MDRFSVDELESMQRAYCCMKEHFGLDMIDEMLYEMVQTKLKQRKAE